jgi:hypothetical protein
MQGMRSALLATCGAIASAGCGARSDLDAGNVTDASYVRDGTANDVATPHDAASALEAADSDGPDVTDADSMPDVFVWSFSCGPYAASCPPSPLFLGGSVGKPGNPSTYWLGCEYTGCLHLGPDGPDWDSCEVCVCDQDDAGPTWHCEAFPK